MKVMRVVSALMCGVLLSSCAVVQAPVLGLLYTDVGWGTQVPDGAHGSKTGTAEATSILGIFATGDASVEAAASDGGITNVKSVDHHSYSILGIYAKFTTTVTGD